MPRPKVAIRRARLRLRPRRAWRASDGATAFLGVWLIAAATPLESDEPFADQDVAMEFASDTSVDPSLQAMMFEVPRGSASNRVQPLPAELSKVPVSLAGRWTDGYMDLDLDVKRQLARVDDGPWEAFQIKDLAGKMLVFTIGREQFIALHDQEGLMITRFSDRSRRALMRSPFRPTLRS